MALLKIDLPFKIKKPILAVGADMKNSLCFAFHKSAFISEVISDLQILDNFKKFKKRVTSLPRRFKLFPQIIAYDKHPEYFSTKYILNSPKTKNLKLIPVQHHHAHIAACMLENKLDHQQVIGVAFDGTGLGDDSTLWGGEFLIADYRGFQRSAHLQYIPLLGGQQAIMQPWRVALAWLYLTFGNNFFDLDLDFLKRINKRNWDILRKMWKRNFNTPLVSSMGRLFDAVGSLLLGIYQVKFEAEAAINLEKAAASYKAQPQGYGFKIKKSGQAFVIDPIPALKQIVTDLKHKHTKAGIAA
ncbi:MAG: carbamoyltransferase HypF, partial [Candidatus Omnitrophota bacterium]